MGFEQHEIGWTREKISRFWNYYASSKAREDTYFSKLLGGGVLDEIGRRIALKGPVLDYGCGMGFMLEELLRRKVPCQGLEFSEKTVDTLIRNFGDRPHFGGIILGREIPFPVDNGCFELVLMIESLEHLLPDDLEVILKELFRMIRRGGHIAITAPHRENLEKTKVICPDCGAIFHRMQHLSSWTPGRTRMLMESKGFETVFCREVTFRQRSRLNSLRSWFDRLSRKNLPHLLYIGQKPLIKT